MIDPMNEKRKENPFEKIKGICQLKYQVLAFNVVLDGM
jgi:hypothetical protein